MNIIGFLITMALFLGVLGVGAFICCLRSNQYDEGAAWRILEEEDNDDRPGGQDGRPRS